MSTPIYVLAGQSNAGSLYASHAVQQLIAGSGARYIAQSYQMGGTALAASPDRPDWYPVEDGDPASGEMYETMRAGIAATIAATPGAYLAGVVWVQGEGDAALEERALAYRDNLSAFIDRLRGEFGESVAVAVVALAANIPAGMEGGAYHDHWGTVRAAQIGIAETVPGVTLIDPDVVLPATGLIDPVAWARDHIHYDVGTAADTLARVAFATLGAPILPPIIGTAESDTLTGTAGADTVLGLDGNDALFGGAGNDYLDGGERGDTMRGGAGSDVYIVDGPGDRTIEFAGEGTDTVITRGHWTLGVNVEILDARFAAAGAVLTGNNNANTILGGAGGDAIRGAGGNDILNGGAGADVIAGGWGDDRLNGGADNDTLRGEDGRDVIQGGAGDDIITGGKGADRLIGESGDDLFRFLDGGDVATGGDGDDVFQIVRGFGRVTITDFDTRDDELVSFGLRIDEIDRRSSTVIVEFTSGDEVWLTGFRGDVGEVW